MTNRYKGLVKMPKGGVEWVEISASNSNHAKQLLESMYGHGKVSNVCQAT